MITLADAERTIAPFTMTQVLALPAGTYVRVVSREEPDAVYMVLKQASPSYLVTVQVYNPTKGVRTIGHMQIVDVVGSVIWPVL